MQLGIALRELLILLLIATAAIVVYANSTSGSFLFDDRNLIVDNPTVHSLYPLGKHFSGTRPVTQFSFALNYHFGGLDVAAYHYVNIAIHTLAAMFLYGLLHLTFRSSVFDESTREYALWIAAIAALVWTVHPLNTQAVTYIVQRGESMMGMSMFAFLFFIALSNSVSFGSKASLLIAFLALAVGLGSKQVMVMALPVALLYQRAFFSDSWREVFKGRWWFWSLCVLPFVVGIVVFLPGILGDVGGAGFGLELVSPTEYLATQPQVVLHYLRLMFWPVPLVFDYGWPPEKDVATIAITASIVGVIFLLFVAMFWKAPHWSFWGLAFFLVLAPTSTILPLQDLAVEHRTYAPTAFIVAGVIAILFALAQRVLGDNTNLLVGCLAGLIVCGLGYLTTQRNLDYQQPTKMWQDVIDKTVGAGRENMFAGRTYCNLGKAHGDLEDWDESIKWLELALQEESFPVDVHGNLARAFMATGNLVRAKQEVIKAISIDPENAKLIQQAGLISAMEKDHAQAEFHFRRALEKQPKDKLVVMNLAQSLVDQRKYEEATEMYEAAINLDPKFVDARRRQLNTYLRFGKTKESEQALADYRSVIPEDPYVDFYQGEIFLRQKKLNEAIPFWEKSLRADPPPKGVHFQLGNAYRLKGNGEKAQRHYENAIRFEPNNVQALNNLGGMVAKKNPRLAIGYFERVTAIAPDFVQAQYNIASLSLQLGDAEKAQRVLKQLLDAKPDFEPAKELLKSITTMESEKLEAVGN